MNFGLRTTQTLALATISACTGAIAALPSQAATLSFSETQVIFSNFSSPEAIDVDVATYVDTVAIAIQGEVSSNANAEAAFQGSPPLAGNIATSDVLGSGTDYIGTALSQATLNGRFAVQGEFSFNFQALLNLFTSVDDSVVESASASGGVLFQLFDSTDPNNKTLLDTFSISGLLDSTNSNDFLTANISPYVTLFANSGTTQSFGGNQESATAFIDGVYKRTFEQPLFITLVESKTTSAKASAPVNAGAVPEPFTVFGTIVGVVGGAILKRRKAIASCEK